MGVTAEHAAGSARHVPQFGPAAAPRPVSLGVLRVLLDSSVVLALLLVLGWKAGILEHIDTRVLLAWVIATPLLQLAVHRLFPYLLVRVLATEAPRRTAVIAGVNQTGCLLARHIVRDPLAMDVAGYFDDRDAGRLAGVGPQEMLGSLAELPAFVKQHHVDVVYCALPCWHPRIRSIVDGLHDTTASVYFVPDMLSLDPIQSRVDTIAGIPVIALCESPLHGLNALAKRACDILMALLCLSLVAPLWLAIAIGIKLDSRGPVLFRQRRYGMDGREIVVFKFRTMHCLEDGATVPQAARGDPRVTRLGRFLRAYSLDELPQLLNVLQGCMSMVGPRPHAVAHNELYRKLIPGYMLRHKVKPGITGLAQVRGLRGATDTESMRARIHCDLEYLREWSLLLDCRILVRTLGVVLRRENAY
ncbi:MAG TPA: undecaprenyl-phosphate glucose phosphotransferase [Steroidobacteraceae bacterium]|nr:undecaprenyl-phosphate glucose phosphotransferase [Steroidobacteraceae bacterium]